jgi:hypothetical protein
MVENLGIKEKNCIIYGGENSPFYGIERSQETKDKISKNRLENGIGVGCSNPRARKVIDTNTLTVYCSIDNVCDNFSMTRDKFYRLMKNNQTSLMYLEDYIKLNPNYKND